MNVISYTACSSACNTLGIMPHKL